MARPARRSPVPPIPPRRPRGPSTEGWVWRYVAFLAVVVVVLVLLVSAPPDWFEGVRLWMGQNVAFVLVAALAVWSAIVLVVRLRRRNRRLPPVRRKGG
ncbi:MAG: hypothetical protein Q7T26_03710 [Dehalococcoidia bacterium]|nr:hypothetical protein [Dehalococcoidia bacterium]